MPEIIHVERHSYTLKKEDIQRILFSHFKVQTGNHSKMNFTFIGTESMRVEYEELLEHDDRVTKLKLSPAKKKEQSNG